MSLVFCSACQLYLKIENSGQSLAVRTMPCRHSQAETCVCYVCAKLALQVAILLRRLHR